jgi:predicted metal-dependent hydrolase
MIKTQDLKFIFFGFIFFSLFLFFGCLQPEYKDCSKYSGESKDQCVEYYAVLLQQPEGCYGISNLAIRERCFLKATTSAEAEKLKAEAEFKKLLEQRQKQEEQTMQATQLDIQLKNCMEQLKTKNVCLLEIAKNKKDISLCNQITEEEYRRQCITSIALMSKEKANCGALIIEADKQLCLFYSS